MGIEFKKKWYEPLRDKICDGKPHIVGKNQTTCLGNINKYSVFFSKMNTKV